MGLHQSKDVKIGWFLSATLSWIFLIEYQYKAQFTPSVLLFHHDQKSKLLNCTEPRASWWRVWLYLNAASGWRDTLRCFSLVEKSFSCKEWYNHLTGVIFFMGCFEVLIQWYRMFSGLVLHDMHLNDVVCMNILYPLMFWMCTYDIYIYSKIVFLVSVLNLRVTICLITLW